MTSVVVLVEAVDVEGGDSVLDGAEVEAEGSWCWMMVLLTAYL